MLSKFRFYYVFLDAQNIKLESKIYPTSLNNLNLSVSQDRSKILFKYKLESWNVIKMILKPHLI
jgi:hypothetical protein